MDDEKVHFFVPQFCDSDQSEIVSNGRVLRDSYVLASFAEMHELHLQYQTAGRPRLSTYSAHVELLRLVTHVCFSQPHAAVGHTHTAT